MLRNHSSFENDEKAKAALGPVIAKWLATGVLEYVGWNDRAPILLQPCGTVPKGTAPFYRLITDARFGNQLYSDWGVSYTSAAQIGQALHRCDFTFSSDIADAYHLSVLRGCGGRLRPVWRPVVVQVTRDESARGPFSKAQQASSAESLLLKSPPSPPLPGIGPRHCGSPNGPTAKGL